MFAAKAHTAFAAAASAASATAVAATGEASSQRARSPNFTAQNDAILQGNESGIVDQLFETADITTILPFIDKYTLVVFDVDYTLFRSRTSLGTPEWIFHLVKKEKEQGVSRKESFKKLYPLWMRAQKFNEIELMDPRIPKLFQDIKKKAFAYIALTARQPDAAEITAWQLNKFGIDFGMTKVAGLNFNGNFKSPTLYDKGLLLAHDFNKKGEVLAQFLEQIKLQLGKDKTIRRIVFVDDTEKHIYSAQKSVRELGLEFIAFRYSAADAFKKQFNPNLVETERQILSSNHSDSEIRLMLENAGSYEDSSGVRSGSDQDLILQ